MISIEFCSLTTVRISPSLPISLVSPLLLPINLYLWFRKCSRLCLTTVWNDFFHWPVQLTPLKAYLKVSVITSPSLVSLCALLTQKHLLFYDTSVESS